MLTYLIKTHDEKKWHPVDSQSYYAHQGHRNIINSNAYVVEDCVFVEVWHGKKMVFFGTPTNAIEGIKDIGARGNIDLREANIVCIKSYGMKLPKARQNDIVLDKNDLLAPGLLLLSIVIKNYTPTAEEIEAEVKAKEAEEAKKQEHKAEVKEPVCSCDFPPHILQVRIEMFRVNGILVNRPIGCGNCKLPIDVEYTQQMASKKQEVPLTRIDISETRLFEKIDGVTENYKNKVLNNIPAIRDEDL